MTVDDLKQYGLVYLATPFTRYANGLSAAHIDACKLAAKLLRAGLLNIRSPIAEAYPIAWHGGLDPLDLRIWQPFCDASLTKSDALLVGKMPGYLQSAGVLHEISTSVLAGKPVYTVDPITLEVDKA